MRWLGGITDSMDMGLGELWELGDGQGGLVCCGSWGRKESDTTERLNRKKPYLPLNSIAALLKGSVYQDFYFSSYSKLLIRVMNLS